MQNHNHPFVALGDGRHVRAVDIVAVCVEEGGQFDAPFLVKVSLSAAANGYVYTVGRHETREAADIEASERCDAISLVSGNRFIRVGRTAQFVQRDRIVSVYTQPDYIDHEHVWTATVFLDAAGNGKAYRSAHKVARPSDVIGTSEAGEAAAQAAARDAANWDMGQILAELA